VKFLGVFFQDNKTKILKVTLALFVLLILIRYFLTSFELQINDHILNGLHHQAISSRGVTEIHFLFEFFLMLYADYLMSPGKTPDINAAIDFSSLIIAASLLINFLIFRRLELNRIEAAFFSITSIIGSVVTQKNILSLEDNIAYYPFIALIMLTLFKRYDFKSQKWTKNIIISGLIYALTIGFHYNPACLFIILFLCPLVYFLGLKEIAIKYSLIISIGIIINPIFTFLLKPDSRILNIFYLIKDMFTLSHPLGGGHIRVVSETLDPYDIGDLFLGGINGYIGDIPDSNLRLYIAIALVIGILLYLISAGRVLTSKYHQSLIIASLMIFLGFSFFYEPFTQESLDMFWIALVSSSALIYRHSKNKFMKFLIASILMVNLTASTSYSYKRQNSLKVFKEMTESTKKIKDSKTQYKLLVFPAKYLTYEANLILRLPKYFGDIYYVGKDLEGKVRLRRGEYKLEEPGNNGGPVHLHDNITGQHRHGLIYGDNTFPIEEFLNLIDRENVYIHPKLQEIIK
jgi:hypothetical protein